MNFREAIKIIGAISVVIGAFWLFEDRYETCAEVNGKVQGLEYRTVQTMEQFQRKQQQDWERYRFEQEVRWINQQIQDLMRIERDIRQWIRVNPRDEVAVSDLHAVRNDIVNLRTRLDKLLCR